jgi:CDP-diacylglycerol pyrophosphatase
MRIFVAIILMVLTGSAHAADPDALWKIVHDRCVPNQARNHDPKPCAEVTADVAVLKDLVGVAQYLLIPTAQISGIENPALLAVETPNYFAAAWDARRFMDARLGKILPRDAISLAINAISGRSQNQLHIHIDCVRADVRAALAAQAGAITEAWSMQSMPDGLHTYLVRRVADLSTINPFRLLAAERPAAASDMAHQTIVVVGAKFPDGRDGFYVLARTANPLVLDFGSGEELQDHACAVAA